MKLTLFTHENRIGEEIAKTLKSREYSEFKVAVAYARNSGISRIYNELAEFSNNGGKTTVIAGIDQKNTSYQALVNLKTFAKDNLYVHHDKNFEITFHPKVYLFGNSEVEKVIVGSSNFTAGGFFLNYEANIDVLLDQSPNAKDFQRQIIEYWNGLLRDQNTKKCELSLLNKMLEAGAVLDEKKQKSFQAILDQISIDLPFTRKKKIKALPPSVASSSVVVPPIKEKFAMTLSGFDVSDKSQDPVILIPLKALRMMPVFWNFPNLYTNSGSGYPQLYAIANILIDNKVIKDQHIRIYYYDKKREFRLQCEVIKRGGDPGDIICIQRDSQKPLEYDIELVRNATTKFKEVEAILEHRVSPQKKFSYY